jgi:hypothetical protein
VPLHPCAPMPPNAMSQGSEAQLRHTTPPWRGTSIINHHDFVFIGEGHCFALARVLVELCTLGRGPRDHETLHHVIVFELVPDVVCVFWAGLLEKSLEVVGRRPRLMLVVVHDSHDRPLAGATHLPVVVIIVVGRGHSPLKTLLAPPLGALASALDGNIGQCLSVVAWSHLHASMRKTKFGRLATGGILGRDAI